MSIAPVALAAAVQFASSVATSAATAASAAATSGLASVVGSEIPRAVASVLPSGVTTTTPVAAVIISAPVWLEIAATLAGALSGALSAVEKRFDVFGLFTLAVVNGLGGGIIRDVLLQNQGIAAFQNLRLLGSVAIAAVIGFFFASAVRRLHRYLLAIDTLSLALFAIVGADKALRAGLGILPAIMLGTITCVGGSILRSMISSEVPQVMRPGSLYGTAALVGSTAYVLMVGWLDIVKLYAFITCIVLIAILRTLSVWLKWETPEAVDLTDHLVRGGTWMLRRFRRGR